MSFVIENLDRVALESARSTDRDASGNPVAHLIAEGGEPLRCCLRNAQPGERCILFCYEPVIPASPYREMGAVFAHETTCDGPHVHQSYPEQWRGRPQVLRAYDARGWIHDSTHMHDGSDPEVSIERILSNPEVVQIHSRNVEYGCYMFTVRRA